MYIHRKTQVTYGGIKLDIYVDGIKYDKIRVGQKKELNLSDGYHTISLGHKDEIISNEIKVHSNETTNLVCNTNYLFDIYLLLLLFSCVPLFTLKNIPNLYDYIFPFYIISTLAIFIYRISREKTVKLKKI